MFSRIQSHIARKQHKCSLCGGAIEKGEQYTRAVVGGDGVDFCDDKYHSKCYDLVERYCRKLDADYYFELWHVIDDVVENVCSSCEKNTMCDLKNATIANCDRVQKQYEVKKI